MGIVSHWNRITSFFIRTVEKCFYNLGISVATHPWRTVGLCWLFVGISSLGLICFYQEKHPIKLWIPPESDFARDTNWLIETFNVAPRLQHILITAPNVLEPSVLAEVAKINEKVNDMVAVVDDEQFTWRNICMKVPIMPFTGKRKQRSAEQLSSKKQFSPFSDDFFGEVGTEAPVQDFEPSADLDPTMYCNFLNSLEKGCAQRNILDIWMQDRTVIENLKLEDVIHTINTTRLSPVLGYDVGFMDLLGGIDRDENGRVVSAKSLLVMWYLLVNISDTNSDKTGNLAGTEEWASEASLAWEKKFLEMMHEISGNVSLLNIEFEAGRSFGDISNDTMFQDLSALVFGIAVMFIYILLIISKWKWVEIRLTLGSVGLLSIGMAFIVAVSLCSLMQIPFGIVHTSLPFLIMGLGIDDVFVMKACWEHLTEAERKLSRPEQVGLMLKHAGVSIVITSFTDIVALLVGAITILPSLQSFCIYAAVSVFFIFVFSVTFYVAIFVLDLQRMDAKRNGIILCIKHPDHVPTDPDKRTISQIIIRWIYSKIIFTRPSKIIVVLFTIIMTGFSFEALLKLEQKFDPIWFIPDDTYYKRYLEQRQQYYPDMGNAATLYIGALNYTQEMTNIFTLVDNLKNESDILQDINTWTDPLHTYVQSNFKVDIRKTILSDIQWRTYLSKFLFSPIGGPYQPKFRFSGELECGKPTPPVTVSSVDFNFKSFSGPKVYLPAANKIKSIVREANFTTGDKFATIWAKVFANWVTDEVIQLEVERNLELALVCVMACTVILVTDLQMCFWIFCCVLLTIVNVCGWMQRWGLTVDIISCVGLELAIGLCVDYAAHVGHTFLNVEGTRNERAFKTVTSVGTAVIYGGGSTFLALAGLSTSKSYIFRSFFKIFFLVITFGLFHGIVFLPVILSLIGPASFTESKHKPIKAPTDTKDNEKFNEEELVTFNVKES